MRIRQVPHSCFLVLLGILCAGVRAELPGEAEAWRIESPPAPDGPRFGSVYSIEQDRAGFLWLATDSGLLRYDGYGFKPFASDPDPERSSDGLDVSMVYEDGTGAIWVGTWGGGLGRIDPRTDTLTRYPSDPDLPGRLRDDRIQVVYEDSRGEIWIGTFAGGLARFDRETETFVTYRHDSGDPASLAHDRVWSIVEYDPAAHGSGRASQAAAKKAPTPALWIATSDGISVFDRASETFMATRCRISASVADQGQDVVRTLAVDRRGVLWAGARDGLFRIDRVDADLADPERDGSLCGCEKALDTGAVNVVFEDSSSNLWVGTQDDGLYLLDRVRGTWRSFRHEPDRLEGLSHNDVRALFEDRSRVLWIGTRGGGVDKLDLKPRKFHHVSHRPDDPSSLGGKVVRALAEDASGTLWIGTDDGLDRYDRAGRRFVHLAHGDDAGSLPGADVPLLYVDRSDQLWVGVWRRGLSRYLGEGRGFETFRADPGDPSSLRSDVVTDLVEDRSGIFWIGTDRGLSRFDPELGTLEHFRHRPGDPESLADNLVWVVHESADGVIRVGTDSGGLGRYDAVRRRFETYRHDTGDPRSLSHDRVFAIHQEPSGHLWIGTARGLNEQLDDGTFRRYQEAEGLPGASVLSILSDGRGRLWLATHQGISRFDPTIGEIRSYDVRAFAPDSGTGGSSRGRFLAGAALRRRDGRLVFGGNDGLYWFAPERIVENPYAPPVVLTGFRRFNEPVELGPSPSLIELSHRDNFFAFEFAALDFTRPERNRYRYRLESFDRDWIEAGLRRFASYTNVDPGDYVFRVQGSNSDGVWNEEGLAVRVRIEPPWWRSVGARFVGAALLVALGGTVYHWQIGRHMRRERELQQRVEESHSELRRSEARYRKLFERNLAGVVRATVDGRILDCNDAFARIFGYTSRRECRLRHRLRFSEAGEPRNMLDEIRARGSYETTAKTRDGSEVSLLWNANLVMDETAEGLVIEGTVIDISERQRIEERMRREQKLESLEVLAGGIAHDFNNLLVGILGNAELARLELDDDSPVLEHLDDIRKTADRAATLAKKMLAYSGKGRFVITNLDLSSVVEDAMPLLGIPPNVRVERHLRENLPSVQADAAQIHQLLSNLVSNAAEAIGESAEGSISLTTGMRHCDRRYLAETFLDQDLDEGLYVFLEVRDDGPGIDPEVQPKIFDPFFTTRFPGRGLGLPVVLGIVRGHRGALDISSAPGRGTVVQVLLPASDDAVTAPIPIVDHDASWRGSGKVLVVDDEAVVRRIAGQMLEMLGFEVLVAAGGDEGVELYRRHGGEIVLVVLDLTMPKMSGEEAFHEIRRIRGDARVLLASGYEKQRATEHFEGLAGFIQKPFHLATLREKVRRALGAG